MLNIDIMKKFWHPSSYILYSVYEVCIWECEKYFFFPLQIGFLQAMYLFASLLPSPLIPSYWLPFTHNKKNTPNMEENLLSSLGVYKVGSIIDGTHSYVREMKYTLKVPNNNSHKKTTINFDSGIVFQKKFNWPLLHKPSCPTPPPLPT